MDKILIFAGTTEGRELAVYLSRHNVAAQVCVATEYGEQLLIEERGIKVHTGRLSKELMADLMKKESITLVIDATHPYATEVSKNIKDACKDRQTEYLRLLRESVLEQCVKDDKEKKYESQIVLVPTVDAAVEYLRHTTGNVLVTTGSKELSKFTVLTDYKKRIFARVLSTPEVAKACAELGFQGRNLICMQGPFGEELNYAMLKQVEASYMVTKESGKSGGFEEKLRAAARAGVKTILIGRPAEDKGSSMEEVKRILFRRLELKPCRQIAVAGIGMGASDNMTIEAYRQCQEAELIIGAKRILETVEHLGKPMFYAYKEDEIKNYIERHTEYEKITILLSGDIGFYSGAKKLAGLFPTDNVKTYCGISSVVYFCGKLKTSWEDVYLMSLHGRTQNIIQAVQQHKKVFALVGQTGGVNELCERLCSYGLSGVKLCVGENLSYPEERIRCGTAGKLREESFEKLSVVLIKNAKADPVVTHGIDDEEFLRAKVPMTKSEIRSISLSKLRLKKDSVIYDVGAGTGSVSIEMALQANKGCVYAIEKKKEAVELIRENKVKFRADNLEIVEGLAPDALHQLKVPTHAFIGGSSGNLKEIMELILAKNHSARIVINAIALETVAEALECIKTLPVVDVDIAAVSVGKSKEVGSYHMMMGSNPVYIISCSGGVSL